MKNSAFTPQDQIGMRMAALLDQHTKQLPYDISERLRAARTRALAAGRAKRAELITVSDAQIQSNGTVRLPFQSSTHDIYKLLASFIPLVCLAAGLMLLYDFHNNQAAMELAEIDSALLIDDLPPQAYADPAFFDFLKNKSLQKD
jgi:Protein of unknown function (DUF3619)